MKRLCLLLMPCLLLSGCVLRTDPRAELKAAATGFEAAINILDELESQGQLGDDEKRHIAAAVFMGERYLIQWNEAIQEGRPHADIMTAFELLLDELLEVAHDRG